MTVATKDKESDGQVPQEMTWSGPQKASSGAEVGLGVGG